MDRKNKRIVARALLRAADALDARTLVQAGSIDTLIGRLENVKSEVDQALAAAKKLKQNPAKFAPQADNLRSSLKSVMQTAKVLLREADKVSGSTKVSGSRQALEKMAKHIKRNEHTHALMVAAGLAKDTKTYKAVQALVTLEDYFGSLPPGGDQVRSVLSKRVKFHLGRARLDEDLKDDILQMI